MRASGVTVIIVAAACSQNAVVAIDADMPRGVDDGGSNGSGGSDGGTGFHGTMNTAFVTSQTYLPTTFGSDFAGADEDCMTSARAVGLQGMYVAYLSSSTVNARDRLQGSRGWIRVDGSPFLDLPTDIATGKVFSPLTIDELGANVGRTVVDTGSLAAGTSGGLPGTCSNYSDPTASIYVGATDATAGSWSEAAVQGCNLAARLYCFGLGRSMTLTPTASPGRQAFVTVEDFTPDATGLAAADKLCTTEAALASPPLTGTFMAMLPTTKATGMSRFSLTGLNWNRLDGVAIAASPLALASGQLDVPLNVTSSLAYVGSHVADASAGFNGMASGSNVDCNEWTDPAGMTGIAAANYVDYFSFGGTVACGSTPIYCLEK